ncbi:DUF3180 domain-containing protein [Amycolatopsis alkalitolerans]|uniref:DUF3180 domain-containing protein n=1 Tax=Amycolatopsis alkalitolerans TaxID=2547244 RepID=A0A5C4M5F8_9PSEU|nr:DUF3180 domain-containing protein [Amycolatopsis alkalitolerans]TNC27977.1 DUF3180 domain-containing protein [Amycolatopsis alkalitolerans]
MHFTRPRELVIAGLVGVVLAYLAFEFAYNSLPRMPLYAGVTLLVLALIETVLAFAIRSRIRSGQLLGAIGVARAVALAKASSVLGALMLGAWLGAIGALVPRASEVTAAASDLRAAIIGAISAAVLIAAALWLEQCCRTPKQRDQDPDRHSTG